MLTNDGILKDLRGTPEGTSEWVIEFPHPNLQEYSKVIPAKHVSSLLNKQIKCSISDTVPKINAEIINNPHVENEGKHMLQKLKASTEKVISKKEAISKSTNTGIKNAVVKGLAKCKSPSTIKIAGGIVGAVAFIGSVETAWSLVNDPDSLTKVVVKKGDEIIEESVKQGPKVAEEMARNYDENDTLQDLYKTRDRPVTPKPRGLLGGPKSLFGWWKE